MTLDDAILSLKSIDRIWETLPADEIHEFLTHELATSRAEGDQEKSKILWFYDETLFAHTHYIDAFNEIRSGKFYNGWCILETAELAFGRVLRHKNIARDDFLIEHTAAQISRLQGLFPYKLFVSPEFIVDSIKCSICDETIKLRTKCKHKPGEIYDGRLCIRVRHIGEVRAISLVENPVQKYSVLAPPPDDSSAYTPVKFVTDRLRSPYDGWSATLTTLRRPHKHFRNLGRNDPCPCDSKKKYKHCCLSHPEGITQPHYDIKFSIAPPNDLPSLAYTKTSP